MELLIPPHHTLAPRPSASAVKGAREAVGLFRVEPPVALSSGLLPRQPVLAEGQLRSGAWRKGVPPYVECGCSEPRSVDRSVTPSSSPEPPSFLSLEPTSLGDQAMIVALRRRHEFPVAVFILFLITAALFV